MQTDRNHFHIVNPYRLRFGSRRISSINIFTKSELLSFALVRPSDDIYKWVKVLRESAENSSGK